jgi:flagellar operon protein
MSPISNPALVPPGGLATPVVPADAGRKSGASVPTDPKGTTPGTGPTQGASFADALKQADHSHELQFSKHALARVQRRGIELDSATLGRLSQGVQRAASKGSRDSLVLVDGTAFVVSVNNRTVITAVGSEHMKDNVFTNIDSAVIA